MWNPSPPFGCACAAATAFCSTPCAGSSLQPSSPCVATGPAASTVPSITPTTIVLRVIRPPTGKVRPEDQTPLERKVEYLHLFSKICTFREGYETRGGLCGAAVGAHIDHPVSAASAGLATCGRSGPATADGRVAERGA